MFPYLILENFQQFHKETQSLYCWPLSIISKYLSIISIWNIPRIAGHIPVSPHTNPHLHPSKPLFYHIISPILQVKTQFLSVLGEILIFLWWFPQLNRAPSRGSWPHQSAIPLCVWRAWAPRWSCCWWHSSPRNPMVDGWFIGNFMGISYGDIINYRNIGAIWIYIYLHIHIYIYLHIYIYTWGFP